MFVPEEKWFLRRGTAVVMLGWDEELLGWDEVVSSVREYGG